MAQKPPAWTRSDGQIGQVPLMLSQDVDVPVSVGPTQDPNKLAEQIVRQNQPVINKFIAQQRQQIQIGGQDVRNAALPLEGMVLYYNYVQGLERLHYHISPEVEVPPLPKLEIPEIEIPTPPQVSEPEVPEIPTPPEPPTVEEPALPKPEPLPEFKEPEVPEPEDVKPQRGQPDFLYVEMLLGLAVKFGDGASDAQKDTKK